MNILVTLLIIALPALTQASAPEACDASTGVCPQADGADVSGLLQSKTQVKSKTQVMMEQEGDEDLEEDNAEEERSEGSEEDDPRKQGRKEEVDTADDGTVIRRGHSPGVCDGSVRFQSIVRDTEGCLKDRFKQAQEDKKKSKLLDMVMVGEVLKSVRDEKLPWEDVPDCIPWSQDALTADAAIMTGEDAAEHIVQQEWEETLHIVMKHEHHTPEIIEDFADRVNMFLEMCGDKKEAAELVVAIKSVKDKDMWTANESQMVMDAASYVTNKCQLDSISLHYFVHSAGANLSSKSHVGNTCSALLERKGHELVQKHYGKTSVHKGQKPTPHFELHEGTVWRTTDREGYCKHYEGLKAKKPDHWLSTSKELKAYTDCFCVEKKPEMLCQVAHADEVQVVQTKVEKILREELPEAVKGLEKILREKPESLLSGGSNLSYVPIGPCDTPVSCEICAASLCLTTDFTTAMKNGKTYQKMELGVGPDMWSLFSDILEGPSSCLSASCSACLGIKPNDPIMFVMELGAEVEKCNTNVDALASFKIYVDPQICLGGTAGDVASKIGMDCISLADVAWYPFLNKFEASLSYNTLVPLTRFKASINLVTGHLTKAVYKACKNKGQGGANHYNCLFQMLEARGQGSLALKVETGATVKKWGVTWISAWIKWWGQEWEWGNGDYHALSMAESGYNPYENGMLRNKHGICLSMESNGKDVETQPCNKLAKKMQWYWSGQRLRNGKGKCLQLSRRRRGKTSRRRVGHFLYMENCNYDEDQQWAWVGDKLQCPGKGDIRNIDATDLMSAGGHVHGYNDGGSSQNQQLQHYPFSRDHGSDGQR